MSILKELLALHETAISAPFELKQLFGQDKDFGAGSQRIVKAKLEKLWGGKSLAWHGDRFFDHNTLGKAYEKAENAARAEFKDAEIESNIEVDMTDLPEDHESHENVLEIEFRPQIEERDAQECYLGYDPKKDKLYIGFDASVSEDEFNAAFDEAFKKETGQHHDYDEEGHEGVFNKAWEKYKKENHGFYGLIYEITWAEGDYHATEALQPMAGGFYRGTFRMFKQHHPHVIDLRLD